MTIVLAFLQNLWVKDPEGWKDIVNDETRRVGIIRHLLLDYGCLTGRRIKACFDGLLDHMIFEEASRIIAGDSRTICPPDQEHIKACIEKYKPKVIVTFGKVATDAVMPVWAAMDIDCSVLPCPHPAARQKDTTLKLLASARTIRSLLPQTTPMAAHKIITSQCRV